jgi:hypothetical protein
LPSTTTRSRSRCTASTIHEPEPWEATAVDLTRCDRPQKQRAWKRIKAVDPEFADGLKRDLPALNEAFGPVGVEVPQSYIEE